MCRSCNTGNCNKHAVLKFKKEIAGELILNITVLHLNDSYWLSLATIIIKMKPWRLQASRHYNRIWTVTSFPDSITDKQTPWAREGLGWHTPFSWTNFWSSEASRLRADRASNPVSPSSCLYCGSLSRGTIKRSQHLSPSKHFAA